MLEQQFRQIKDEGAKQEIKETVKENAEEVGINLE